MREAHELEKGVVCERCERTAYKGDYIAIVHNKSVVDDTTGVRETVDRFNLCSECYKKYKKFMYKFMEV